MKNFVLIGAAGYIAPRHMKAIKETGNNLLAALDPHDSVGVLDNYFPGADFFTEFERFDRHCEKLKRNGTPIDYVVVCSPNYLHDAHIRLGLRIGADVICEKPVVLNPWNVDALLEMEKETGKKVWCIQQLRLHPSIQELKKKIEAGKQGNYNVELNYITARGSWYHHSWKGDRAKSGGIASNIGVHFFDILLWIFGKVLEIRVQENGEQTVSGFLKLEKAEVNWKLSIDENSLPVELKNNNSRVLRLLRINGEVINFSDGFETLHTEAYKEILSNNGTRLSAGKELISLLQQIREKQ